MKVLAVCMFFASLIWQVVPATAQSCSTFDHLDTLLRDQAHERAVILAVDHDGAAFLFYGNPETETWSIVHLVGNCATLLAYGIGYEAVPVLPGEES